MITLEDILTARMAGPLPWPGVDGGEPYPLVTRCLTTRHRSQHYPTTAAEETLRPMVHTSTI